MYKNSMLNYFAIMTFYAFVGLTLGVLCEEITKYVHLRFGVSTLFLILFQLMLAIFMFYVIEIHVSEKFATNWQTITPGLVFISTFFGLQLTLYNNVDILARVYNIKK